MLESHTSYIGMQWLSVNEYYGNYVFSAGIKMCWAQNATLMSLLPPVEAVPLRPDQV